MSLIKTHYTDEETPITAKNLNDIQDAIQALEDGLFTVDNNRSGESITITDAAKRGLRSLNIYGKTTQAGTPEPEAPVDLASAGESGSLAVHICGKNLFTGWINGGIAPGDGSDMTDTNRRRTDFLPVVNTTKRICISGIPNTLYSMAVFYDANKVYINRSGAGGYSSRSFVTPENAKYFRITLYESSALTGTIAEADAMAGVTMIEIGDTFTEYEKGKPIQTATISTPNGLLGIPVSSGGNYIDENGQQWSCDEIDFYRGVYIKRTHKRVIDENVAIFVVVQGGYNRFEIRYTDQYLASKKGALCSHFKVNPAPLSRNEIDKVITGYEGSTRIFLRFDQCSSIEALAAWLAENPVEFVYELETPIEIPMPQEELDAYRALYAYKDHTTVSNSGHAYMELEYVMDAKKYIDGLVAGGSTGGSILPATIE